MPIVILSMNIDQKGVRRRKGPERTEAGGRESFKRKDGC